MPQKAAALQPSMCNLAHLVSSQSIRREAMLPRVDLNLQRIRHWAVRFWQETNSLGTTVDNKSQVAGLLALVANVMLEKAKELSGLQAYELWRLTQLINTGASLETLPRATLQLAMDFNRFPLARHVLEQKALAYAHTTDKLDTIN